MSAPTAMDLFKAAPPPEQLTDEELGGFVAEGATRVAVFCEQLKPYYLDLRSRFAKKLKAATIHGCRTWDEYCSKVLDRTKRAVNYFLAGGNPVIKRKSGGKRFPTSEVRRLTAVTAHRDPPAHYTPPKPPVEDFEVDLVVTRKEFQVKDFVPAPKPEAPPPQNPLADIVRADTDFVDLDGDVSEGRAKPRYTVTLLVEGAKLAAMTEKAHAAFGAAVKSVEKEVIPTSRQARFNQATGRIKDGKGKIEELKRELEDWKENMPDNLQDSTKAQELDEAGQALDDVLDGLDGVLKNAGQVNFPGM
jgi:hypothetical protein